MLKLGLSDLELPKNATNEYLFFTQISLTSIINTVTGTEISVIFCELASYIAPKMTMTFIQIITTQIDEILGNKMDLTNDETNKLISSFIKICPILPVNYLVI